MTDATIWNIKKIKGANPQKYQMATDLELKDAQRSGDPLAASERLKRMRTSTTEVDRIQARQKARLDEELFQEMKAFNEKLERDLNV